MRMYLILFLSVLGFCLNIAHAGSPEMAGITSWGHPVPSAQLETQRGGTDTDTPTINTNQLNAKLFNNSATNNVTGNNSIADAAFAGASGLATVIQNSGNNVIIQNGTVLNLTLLWREGLYYSRNFESDARRKAYEPPGPDYKPWTWMELNQYAVVDFDIGSVYSPALVADLR